MLDSSMLILAQEAGAPPPHAPGGPVSGSTTSETSEGQAGTGADSDANQTNAPPPGGGMTMWIFLLLIIVVMWVFMFSGQRKEKKKRAAMLAAMQKGNKVQTVGGILGTVVEVRDDEVVVKVDENANTRLRFARSAIQAVLDEPKE